MWVKDLTSQIAQLQLLLFWSKREIAAQVGCSPSMVSKTLWREGSRRSNCGHKQSTTPKHKQKSARADFPLWTSWSTVVEGGWGRDFWAHLPSQTVGAGLPKSIQRSPFFPPDRSRNGCSSAGSDDTGQQSGARSSSVTSSTSFCIWSPGLQRKKGEEHQNACLKRNVKFHQSVMVLGAMCTTGISQLCFIRSTVTTAVYQKRLGAFYGARSWQPVWCCWIHFSARLRTQNDQEMAVGVSHHGNVLAWKFPRSQFYWEVMKYCEVLSLSAYTKHNKRAEGHDWGMLGRGQLWVVPKFDGQHAMMHCSCDWGQWWPH